MLNKPCQRILGLLAGQGDLPRLILNQCRLENRPIFLIALEGQTPLETVENVDHVWIKIGKLGTFIEELKKRNIQDILFAGSIKRPNLNTLSLDWEGVKLLGSIGYKAMGDDAILTVLTNFLEFHGFSILKPGDILKDLIPKQGSLTQKLPSQEDLQDIDKGIKILHLMGSADIGQAIIIQMGQVLGIEAIEGTQRLIHRIYEYKLESYGGVLVKMSKPQQNLKVDLPTIGSQTLHQLHDSKLNGIAIEANRSQIIDLENVVSLANDLRLFIHAF